MQKGKLKNVKTIFWLRIDHPLANKVSWMKVVQGYYLLFFKLKSKADNLFTKPNYSVKKFTSEGKSEKYYAML